MNIPEAWLKIKQLPVNDFAMPLLVIFVGVGSFGLGRLSAQEAQKQPTAVSQVAAAVMPQGGTVIASKTGKKYHFPWCAGTQQISEKNKITFASEEKARAAGYLPAGNCKGLQ
ncbi:MAG: hypothetical protein HYT30_01515 [Parcubacteria group bacterium]|nr:hypothetical protein [Parcubacteria group bacterium]